MKEKITLMSFLLVALLGIGSCKQSSKPVQKPDTQPAIVEVAKAPEAKKTVEVECFCALSGDGCKCIENGKTTTTVDLSAEKLSTPVKAAPVACSDGSCAGVQYQSQGKGFPILRRLRRR